MNNENSQTQAKSHVGGNNKLGIKFAWPNFLMDEIFESCSINGRIHHSVVRVIKLGSHRFRHRFGWHFLCGTACAHAHSQNVLKKYGGVLRRRMFCLLFVVLAKASTFTDGFVPKSGITNCRVNQKSAAGRAF